MDQAGRGGPQPAPQPAGDHPERRCRVSGVPPRPGSAGQAYGWTADPQMTPPPKKKMEGSIVGGNEIGVTLVLRILVRKRLVSRPPPSSTNVSLSACQGLPGGRASLRDAWDVTLARPRAGGADSRRGAMRQRKLGLHTPPCHRRMVIATVFSAHGAGGRGLISAPRAGPIPDGHVSVHGGGGGGLHAGCGLVW